LFLVPQNERQDAREAVRVGFKLNNKMNVKTKRHVLLYFAMLFVTIFSVSAQDCTELQNDLEMRQELQDLANQAANDLMKCCSKWGGNNLSATIIWDKDSEGLCQTRISRLTGKITITMRISWVGSVSGMSYWIKGRLLYDLETRRRSWQKISDSGGFSPGCSNGCIN
jgi:hypothetical protein